MTDTAKRLIEAILKFKSIFTFPDHGGENVNLEAIIKNFGFVETGYLQNSGSLKCDYGYLITLIDNAIKSRNGSILIDIIKEAGKNVNISPQYLMEQFDELFSDAGLQLFESEGKLFDVPSKYRTGEGCSSGEEAIEKAVGCLKDIQLGTMTYGTLKRKAKIVYNIFHVYAHLQTEILTKAFTPLWVNNFRGKDFSTFKEAIDNAIDGIRILAAETKYAREESPYIYFQGTAHLTGPCAVHSSTDPDEEIELLKTIMLDTSIKGNEAFTKAITFIHRSIFQKEIYTFLTGEFEENETHWTVDARQRSDFVHNLVGRYMEQHRKPYPPEVEPKPLTSRYNMQDRDLKPTQSKEETMSTQQEIFKILSGTSSLKEIIEFLKNAKSEDITQVQKVCGDDVSIQSGLIHSMMEHYFGKGDFAEGLVERLKQASQPGTPKIQISGPDGDMLSQLKEMFGDDCVIVPISQGDNISEVLANVMKEQQPQVKTEVKSDEVEARRAKWGKALGVTDPEILDLLTEAVIKDINKESTKVIKTPIKHSRHMSFNVLNSNREPEVRYTGVWDESVSQLVVCFQTLDHKHPKHAFTAKFQSFSDAATAFTEISKGVGVMPVMDVIEFAVGALNGEILSR
ncbi:hypothetical protein SUREIYA_00270 [Serratia phage vB_SmaM-Sureiya]|nr:hypothetical protein SUREIYA_00270 [Serratia phage vB_SmaM-Sureiya]